MIRYLLDSSALWRILRDPALRAAWAEVVSAGAIGSCHPQRVEFRRSARTIDEYEQMSGMFEALYPDAAVPKGTWRWIESAQHRLLRQGAHRALSAVDLMICATAARTTWWCSTTTRTSPPPHGTSPTCASAPSATPRNPAKALPRRGRAMPAPGRGAATPVARSERQSPRGPAAARPQERSRNGPIRLPIGSPSRWRISRPTPPQRVPMLRSGGPYVPACEPRIPVGR